MASHARAAKTDVAPQQQDSWKHVIVTPSVVQGIQYPDGRKGITCTLADHSTLTVVLSERAAHAIGTGLVGPLDGKTIITPDHLPGL